MIAIVDYGMGNLRSVAKAFESMGAEPIITRDPGDLSRVDHIVLPGVGSFGRGMENLRESGLIEALEREVMANKKPFLGICLGMQMLSREGCEDGRHAGLGWIPASVEPLQPRDPSLKVPHMGWNNVSMGGVTRDVFTGLGSAPTFYFAHSYQVVAESQMIVAALCDYGGEFTAAIRQGNILATQFHPEKSQHNGLRFLRNFLEWKPRIETELAEVAVPGGRHP